MLRELIAKLLYVVAVLFDHNNLQDVPGVKPS